MSELSWDFVGLGIEQIFSLSTDPSRRTFWLYLVSALVLAVGVIAADTARRGGRDVWPSRAQLREYWTHPSHLVDIGYLLLNTFIKVGLVIPLLGGQLAVAIIVVGFCQSHWGDAPDIPWLAGWVVLAYTLTFFLAEDLSRFVLHLAMHKVPFLWRFHRIHHSAQVLSPLTLFRLHPVEMVLYYCRSLLVFGLVTGVFVYFFQGQVDAYDILGVEVLGFLFNLLGANLRHSHIWLSFGYFERWFISPAQHQIHHSRDLEHFDKNFGTWLACWDRLFGSWWSSPRPQSLRFGLQ